MKSLAALRGHTHSAAPLYLPAVLVAAIAALDTWHPADVLFSALYVIPIVLTLIAAVPRATYLTFVATSVATVAVAAFGPQPADSATALANRIIALGIQAMATAIVIRQLETRQRDRDRLRALQLAAVQARAAVVLAESGLDSLQDVLRKLPDAVFTLDASGHIIESNPSAARLLGMAVHAFSGRSWDDLTHGLTMRSLVGQSQQDLFVPGWPSHGPTTVVGEMVVKLGGDTEPIYCMVTAAKLFRHGLVTGALVLCRDVTVLRERERQKDEFVSMATHELKTPISTLRGYAQLMEANYERMAKADVATSAERIVRQADRLTRLVTDLLDVSRIHTGRMDLRVSEVHIGGVVRDAVEHQQAIHADRRFILEDKGGAETLIGDGERLEQVLTNLLDNAVKYSPDGGPVTVVLEGTPSEVTITVTDTGVGIPLEEQGQLFQRFYRVRSRAQRFSGLGVGLYISHTIVREHGGQMWVRSGETGGSTFGFVLPVTPALNREPDLIT